MPAQAASVGDVSALNQVLVKTRKDMSEPTDSLNVSDIVKTLLDERRIQRAYVPEPAQVKELNDILTEVER